MKNKNDFIKMFLAGVEWERKRGDKPAIKVAINNAMSQIRVDELNVHPTKSGGELNLPEPSKPGFPYGK